jgi:NADH dehydrogenase
VSTVDLVTGAFGYTGSFIAQRLLDDGHAVRTLTRRQPGDHPLAGRVESVALRFDDTAALAGAFAGVDTFYNTYWMRFERGEEGFAPIVNETRALLEAARAAGVRRVVQFSVTNASRESPTAYFRAKAQVEDLARSCGIPAAIVRPTLLFGPGDILVNNMAWTLRRVPVFGVPGAGDYRVQPVHVRDVAGLAVSLGGQRDATDVDAAGPGTYRFGDMVTLVRDTIRARARIVRVPPTLALLASRLVGLLVHDVVLTRDEVTELTSSLLVSDAPSRCPTRFDDWLRAEADSLGRTWSSELSRNYRIPSA